MHDASGGSGSVSSVIRVAGLQKRYGKLVAVKGIDFDVRQGEIFGLIGPDGAGKTTTFQILAGVMEASEGQVEVLDRPARDARLKTGYLTQQFSLYLDLSIDENIRYSAGLREVPPNRLAERRDRYLKLMGLEQFGDRLAGRLSGGMKQKLALCCALVSQPEILLLDEPTTGVDPVSRREFWDVLATLANQGVTIVVATPYLDEAERCSRIALMYEGKIQQTGTLKELRQEFGLSRLEVRTDRLQAAEQVLLEAIESEHQQPQESSDTQSLVDVQSFGDRLDVLVHSHEMGEAAVKALFKQHQINWQEIQPVDATLENVFVSQLRQQGADPVFIPFPRSSQSQAASHSANSSIAIQTNRLQKTFGQFQAVKDVTLEVRYGEIYGLLGANGAGKTTTIKMLCGLLEASGGEIALAGQTQDLRNPDLRRRIGYMSQKFTLYDDLSVVQNLQFYCGVYGVPRSQRRSKIDWVLTICGLEGQENMLTGRLPGGWKQRVAFGASVMHEPEILFLDEPTSGVDPVARRQFWRLIEDFARRGTAVLVTTHYLEEAEHCNYLGFMVAGEVVAQGSPSQIKAAQPGQLIEIVTDQPQAASDLLKTQMEPWRVSIFGDRLHLVLDHADRELPTVQSLLEEADLTVHSLRPVPFSLEDCFIGIVQRSQR
ncbi:MAG: ATP-binding cassette domain-containing protein [Elainellaceae cyanobacterium]